MENDSALANKDSNAQVTLLNIELDGDEVVSKIIRTEDEWKSVLSGQEFHIVREKGTERPFTGKYNKHDGIGFYECVACGTDLFDSTSKFDSKSGWPSFTHPVDDRNIHLLPDYTLGMVRIEVLCSRCDGHLGHLFKDGPLPTKNRYCINSAALKFKANKR